MRFFDRVPPKPYSLHLCVDGFGWAFCLVTRCFLLPSLPSRPSLTLPHTSQSMCQSGGWLPSFEGGGVAMVCRLSAAAAERKGKGKGEKGKGVGLVRLAKKRRMVAHCPRRLWLFTNSGSHQQAVAVSRTGESRGESAPPRMTGFAARQLGPGLLWAVCACALHVSHSMGTTLLSPQEIELLLPLHAPCLSNVVGQCASSPSFDGVGCRLQAVCRFFIDRAL